MTNNDKKRIKEALSILLNQPLRSIERAGPTIYLEFGELIEIDTIKQDEFKRALWDENGKGIPTKRMAGRYALDILCSMRFTCGDDVIFAKSDIFLPTDEQLNKPGFVWDTFDWHTYGNTSFDEFVAKHFRSDFNEYVVNNVKVGRFGDLTISFENDFALEFFADGSGYSENWRFGEIDSVKSLIVTSKGIIDESFR